MKIDEWFGDQMREARERAGRTHEQVALMAGCTVDEVRDAESGAGPSLVVAMMIAVALAEPEPYFRYAATFGLRARIEALEVAVPLAIEATKRRVAALEAREDEHA